MSDLQEPKITPAPTCTVSTECNEPVDVVLVSSDGHQFGAHKKSLEFFSGGFPFAESTAPSVEHVSLSEAGDVLRLLLEFTHRDHHFPDIRPLSFEIFSALTEAVEKYMIYSGMASCKMRMEDEAEAHPPEVLEYAVKHGYNNLANKVAPLSAGMPIREGIKQFGTKLELFTRWVIYRESWRSIIRDHLKSGNGHLCKKEGMLSRCEAFDNFCQRVLEKVKDDMGCLQKMAQVRHFGVEFDSCPGTPPKLTVLTGGQIRKITTTCAQKAEMFRKGLKERIDALPPFMD